MVESGLQASGAQAGLELYDVSKSFLGVRALMGIDLTCEVGEIHALVGENGAGKSTLIKVASGALAPDTGGVRIAGTELPRVSPAAARGLGLLTAYQDTSLVSGLTVAENVILSCRGVREVGRGVDRSIAADLLAPYDLPFGVDDRVEDLSPASQQLLEVIRCLVHRPRVLLLDEPTAALDVASTARLEELLLEAKQHSAILYISHRLDEVRRLADRVTVLRDGALQGTWQGSDWAVADVIDSMVGVPTDLAFAPKDEPSDEVVLEAGDFSGRGFGPLDISVRAGEIVGIAGSEGNGQRDLLRTLAGLRRGKGTVTVGGEEVQLRSPASALKAGIAFQSGDRAAEAIFGELSVMDNATLVLDRELGPLGAVMRDRERAQFEPVARDLGIAHASPDQPARELSGGNQQKVVMTRSGLRPAKLLIVDEPTQGVDVNARLDIYRVLAAQARAGTAVLVNSSDSAELEGLCHRVYVLSRGHVVKELVGDDVKESKIVASFVDVEPAGAAGDRVDEQAEAATGWRDRLPQPFAGGSSLGPIAVLIALIVLIGAYATSQSDVFLSTTNLSSLLLLTVPLAILAVAAQSTLLTAEFDIAIGSTVSLTVVLLSFLATSASFASNVPGILAVLVVGVIIGLVHSFIVRRLRVNALIATIATLGIIQGLAIIIRPEPGGLIGAGLTDAVTSQIGFVPVAFVVILVVAIAADVWRVRTSHGLAVRATGLDEESSRRTGTPVTRVKTTAYVICGVLATVAGIFVASQVGLGANSVGAGYPLQAFAACFLGGAVLSGGRGSFTGALLGTLFLATLINITPLLNVDDALAQTATGALTIVAVAAYTFQRSGRPRSGRRTPTLAAAAAGSTPAGGAR